MTMDIVINLNYCRRCRKTHSLNRDIKKIYCNNCANIIAKDKNAFNRWQSSDIFINLSFLDCIDDNKWDGFTNIKYNKKLIDKILLKFPAVKYHQSIIDINDFLYNENNTRYLYLISDNKKNLLKVGQTYNIKSRFNKYYNLSSNKPLKYDVFYVDSFEEQDLYEHKIRNYLEYLGYLLPKDNSNLRLKYIKGDL